MTIKRHAIASCIGSIAFLLAAVTAAIDPSYAQIPVSTLHAPLPAGNLSEVLRLFAERSGLQIVYLSKIAANLRTPGAPAGLMPQQALTRLLIGTGLKYRFTDATTITIFDGHAAIDDPAGAAKVPTGDPPASDPPKAADDPAPSTQIATAPRATDDPHGNVLQEVLVTGSRKRNENVQTTPIAVTALDQHVLERAHVTNFDQIGALAPNLEIHHGVGTAAAANVYLRGFGSQSNDPAVEPHVATFIDGIYQASPSGNLFDLFDIAQVEVDAGPQGTLSGKNAAIGAIYITSAKPTGDFSGELEGDYGSYDHVGLRGVVNIPIMHDAAGNSILAARLSLVEKEGGNWIYNIANGKRDMGGENAHVGRFALSFTPDTNFRWDLVASLDQERSPQNGNQPADNTPGFLGTSSSVSQHPPALCLIRGAAACVPYAYGTTNATFTTRARGDLVNAASTMSYQFDPVTLTSVTGYVNYWLDDNQDDPGTPLVELNAYHDRTRSDSESEELRLSSRKGGGWDMNGLLDWVVGGYFSNFSYSASNHLGVLLLNAPAGVANVNNVETGVTQSEAAFAHVIVNFTDQWTGTFGVRQSWDQKQHAYEAPGRTFFTSDIPAGFHNTSFEAGTAYQFDRHRMAYFRFAQGYQAGGFNGTALGNTYQSEVNNAYEVGLKSDWLDNRLRANVDLFVNELSQLQVSSAQPIPTPPGFIQETLNAGSATVEGAEAQIVAVPVENLTTHLNLGYLHPRYNRNQSTVCANATPAAVVLPTDCSGVPFANAPKWTIDLGADYVFDLPENWGTTVLSADWTYRSTAYTSDPPYPNSRQEGYGLVNATLKYEDPTDTYSVEFYGTNIFDRHYISVFTDPAAGSFTGISSFYKDGRPAEWGMRLTYKFGGGG